MQNLDTPIPFMRELPLKRGGVVFVSPGRAGKSRTKPGVWYPFTINAVVEAEELVSSHYPTR